MTRNICVILQGKHVYMYCLSVAEVRLPHLYSNLISINTPQSVLDLLSPVYLNKILTELFNRLLPLHFHHQAAVSQSASFSALPLSLQALQDVPTSTEVAHQPKEFKFCTDHMLIVNSVELSAPWRISILYMKMYAQTHTTLCIYITHVCIHACTLGKTQKSFPQAIDILIKITQDTCATQFFSK